ncbi:MAG: hypothetical protein IPM17_01005 [Verrucomicrobia bacterium]|nr:hypothetical protein [Verrucomicrobiota bacterium]
MKYIRVFLLLVMFTFSALPATPREAEWKKVEEAMQQGLPQTAIEALGPIIRGALADRAWAEATKAICRRIALEGQIQGHKAEEKITRLEAELATAPGEIQPLLQTVLANWYWQYFQQNRWRFLQRTATAQPPGEDFTTWDLPRLFAEIDRHFTAALAAEAVLKTIPIAAFDDLLTKGTLPDSYRPTLYDFIAHEALKFCTSGEQAGARPQDAFRISADDPIFDPAPQFLAWKPVTTETNAAALKAVQLYQALLRFHRDDAEQTAFLDVDLARLTWGKNIATGASVPARYVAALKRFAEQNGDHELAAVALHEWAVQVENDGNPVEARELARRGRDAHPNSPGGRLCANLIARLEARSASLTTERIWNAPWPEITVRYRNVTNVWFRAVESNWDDFLSRQHRRPENLSEAERQAVLARAPSLAWSAPLPPTTDLKEHTVHLPAPTTLKPGFYFLIASHNPEFTDADNQLSMTDIWVSDLALVIRQREGNLEGFVLEALTGEPISGARVESWYLNNRGERVAVPAVATDEEGFFSLTSPDNRGILLKATARNQSVATADEYHRWRGEREAKPFTQTIFFTDRAIYRPGQTIQYKGICLRADQPADNYEVLKGQRLTVVLYDPNNKEIARQEHRANDYGSFSGSFTAPRDRLMGSMRLQVISGPPGGAGFSVEEYKRPKFQVVLDVPKTAAKLNGDVKVSGHATAYTGAAIDDAEVRYRVVRQVRMPWWWGWGGRRGGWPFGESQEIAHGTLRTGTDGRFEISFTATPDPSVPEADEPTFDFEVHADVTDGSGETRSDSRSLRLGYTALEARLSADGWQTSEQPVQVSVRTTTLDGEPQVAEGSLKIHALIAPERVQRPPVRGINPPWQPRDGSSDETVANLADPNDWPLGAVVFETGFTTDTNGVATVSRLLPAGAYRVVVETQDRFGKTVTGRLPLQVVNPGADKFAIRVPHFLDAPSWEVQPGEEFSALWGTGYETGRAFVEIQHRGKLIQRYWTKPGTTQARIQQTVTEAMRGGFTLLVTFVRENRAHVTVRPISVPWRNQELALRWEHFTSKLQPGQRETWTLEVRSPKPGGQEAERWAAECVATLYDASLDAFVPLNWPRGFGVFRQESSDVTSWFANVARGWVPFRNTWQVPQLPVELSYRDFPPELRESFLPQWAMMRRHALVAQSAAGPAGEAMVLASPAPMAAAEGLAKAGVGGAALAEADRADAVAARQTAAPSGTTPRPDLAQVSARRNLNETAFFFPHLLSDTNGVVRLQFTLPEALTEWRFLGFAHDRRLRAGLIEGRAVTAKDLMVQPNPPRFLREGDVIEFTVKVSNQSDQTQRGQVQLTFNDGFSDQPADARLGNTTPAQPFEIPARESRSFAWRITVPDGLSVLTYKAVGATATVSDGEEGFVPVLARRLLVTESLPLPIRGPATRQFNFKSLAESGASDTLTHQSLTLQVVSQPAWYAVMALPYLMEFPHECSEQTFNRYYANTLARLIANSDPKIRRVFDLWKGTAALESPLTKNPDLKSVLLDESPWVREALRETEARQNVGVLFDDNRLGSEMSRALDKLREAALPDGGWSWFPGGPRNEYITLYIVTGFGRLRHLGADVPMDLALRSLEQLDAWMARHHARIVKDWKTPEDYVPSSTDALYLYGRSFFLKDRPLTPATQPAVDFFLARAREHWLKTGGRQTQGHLALALNRFGDPATAQAIVRSLKERSVTSEELGRFWRDTELSWWWYHAPIETQALMIEVFAEVAQDTQAVEDCQVWLLKQKQTQNWKTTKATADAVYALLLRGKNLLASDTLVELTVGGKNVTPHPGAKPNGGGGQRAAVEPGTGFYEVRFVGPEVKPELGAMTVKKVDDGVAWGSAHWQYFEDMTKVKPYEGTPLKLKKTLFTKKNTDRGPVLEAVRGPVAVGDELVVRIELRVDRDMEYVHLKDHRGSGTEPVSVLSGYRYQDGLGYYESTRDTASHFFIAYLPKGTYVFEYSTRVQLRGEYQTGLASIQCMYAPEFNSHSESFKLVVN